jgi:hypothetical protein
MIKFIAAALWICAATLGAVFYSYQVAGARAAGEPPKPFLGGLDYIRTDIISVPLVHDSRIDGYFLTRLVYTVEPGEMKKLSVPAEALITDEVHSYLYKNPQVDFSKKDTIDLDAFRSGVRDAVNTRVGAKLVSEVLIEQIDYLSKDEIRDNAIRRRAAAAGGTAKDVSKAFKEH